MKVSDIMTAAAMSESPDDSLADASAKMWSQQMGSLLVMDGDLLIGIVTERDVLRCVAEGKDPKSTPIRDAMTKSVVSIGPDTNAQDAARIMLDKWFRHLPVATEDGRVLGIISLRDLLSLLFEGLDSGGAGGRLVRDRRTDRVEKGE